MAGDDRPRKRETRPRESRDDDNGEPPASNGNIRSGAPRPRRDQQPRSLPAPASTRLSASRCHTSRKRPAPSARTEGHLLLLARRPGAIIRLATLTQATNNTTATMAIKTISGRANSVRSCDAPSPRASPPAGLPRNLARTLGREPPPRRLQVLDQQRR